MRFLTTKVLHVMTSNPVCSTPGTTLDVLAQLMHEHRCGEIPICNDEQKVIGVITDRDIVTRCVAAGKLPHEVEAREIMTAPAVTVHDADSLSKAFFLMEEKNVRRLPVTDATNRLIGVISQVDIAARASQKEAGRLLARRGRVDFAPQP